MTNLPGHISLLPQRRLSGRASLHNSHHAANDKRGLRWGAGKGLTELVKPGQQWWRRHWVQACGSRSPREPQKTRFPSQFAGARKLWGSTPTCMVNLTRFPHQGNRSQTFRPDDTGLTVLPRWTEALRPQRQV